MNRRPPMPPLAILLVLLLLGCAPSAGQPTPTANPTEQPTPGASPAAMRSDEPDTDEPMPPAAMLRLPDGSTVEGKLGSYDYDGAAADGPWMPATALAEVSVPSQASLEFSLAGGQPFLSWSARYADAQDTQADVISSLAAGGNGSDALERAGFGGLPSGAWVLMIQVRFVDDLGDAAYYWHLLVP